MQIACRQPFSVCFMAFTIKDQTKAAAAFKVISLKWPLLVKAMKQTENGCQQATFMQNLNKIIEKMAFDGKGKERLPTSYLHAKFEQNWSINGRDTFKGRCGLCLAFDGQGHETN